MKQQLFKTAVYPRIVKYAEAKGLGKRAAITKISGGAVHHWLAKVDDATVAIIDKALAAERF